MQWALHCSAAVAALLLPALPAHARTHHSRSWTDSQFAAASQLQESLEARPVEQRTRHDYQRVIDAYRRIYLAAPISPKAEPSVVASAQVMEEMGRRFRDPDILRSAIKQYEFLRREYPGSKFRFDALFRIGEIYQDDLHDKASADAAFEEFLRRYPHNQFAQAARSALAEPAQQQAALSSKHTTTALSPDAGKTASKGDGKSSDAADADDDASDETAQSQVTKSNENSAEEDSQNEPATLSQKENGRISRVLGIRHWSTPEYTRVAIDLEQGVKFESQRIDNPDRVFFDLLNTKLDRKLAGKSFEIGDGLLKSVRVAQFKAGQSRIVLDLDGNSEFSASLLANPPRLIIDIRSSDSHNNERSARQPVKTPPLATDPASASDPAQDTNPASNALSSSISDTDASPTPAGADSKKSARRIPVLGDNGVRKTIVDADDDNVTTKTSVAKLEPPEIKPVNKVAGAPEPPVHAKSSSGKNKRQTPTADLDVREAQPNASGDRSLIRALGLKIGKIVIDPGHGGHDTGTIGPNGLEEKDLVLDVSRRLGKLLQARLGAEVIYTRKDDTFIPLETRTAIANQESADLFVSVHANSSHDPDARGVETYYLNFTSSPEALEVAARENAVSEKSIHELQDLVKKIALREKIEESHEFASDVQNSLHSGLAAKNPGVRDRGVKKAPFIVLIGANMPSILAEISFVSNPGDEHRLKTQEYRQKIAESLYRGIAKYVSGLSGVKVASKIDKDEGQ
jgi:N-acetylmuramoyl-L-alanine amidase